MATRTIEQSKNRRPTFYEEPLDVRKPIMFTRSQVADVQRASGPSKDFSEFVRSAVLEKLAGGSAPQSTEQIEMAVRLVMNEMQRGQLAVPFDDLQKAGLDQAAQKLGFIEGAGLLKSLALKAMSDPGAAQEFLFGATERAFEAGARDELAARKTTVKTGKATRKAA